MTLPLFRLPAGKLTPILSLISFRRLVNPSFDFALLLHVEFLQSYKNIFIIKKTLLEYDVKLRFKSSLKLLLCTFTHRST